MVHQAADGGVHVAGGHAAHQVKAHVDQGHVAVIRAHIVHDAADQCLGQLRAGVADGLTHQILGAGDVLILQGQHDVQGRLHHSADGLHGNILLGAGLNDILLIVQADVRLSRRHKGNGIVGVGGESDVDLQTLIGIVALLHGHIHKGVEGVGVPVQHHVQLLQVAGGVVIVVVLSAAAADAAQQQHAGQQHGYDTFHSHIPLLILCVFQNSPRQRTTFFSSSATSATAAMATTDSSTMGAKTPAPSSWVIMRREK